MIIRKYGIELHRLTHDDIELVRQMRNRDDIRLAMFDQHFISPEEQEAWFRSINNVNNYYFIVHHQGKKVGLASGKNVDWEKRESEGGLFIWEAALIGTPLPAIVSILMMELTFDWINLQQTLARVRPDHQKARQYHLSMGYAPTPNNDKLVLTRQAYREHIPKLRRLASACNCTAPLSMDDMAFPTLTRDAHLYRSLPADILARFAPKLEGIIPIPNGH